MKIRRVPAFLLAGALALPVAPAASADDDAAADAAAPAAAQAAFTAEQLDQLVGPIALHPDALVAQIFMGATYPIEIVQAARWRAKNAALRGDSLDAALKDQDWDISVKSLCTFPDVLKQMNENLDWTQDLGDAYLGQAKDLMDAVQRMRAKANDAGNLKTTEQQKVVVTNEIIVIESTSPEVIYVPTYYPSVVYGVTYPTYYYPAYYAPPPVGYRPGLTFAAGVAVGAAVWGNCNWNSGDIDIDVDHHYSYEKNVNRNTTTNTNVSGSGKWSHDPQHRKGANYKNPDVASRYGASGASSRVSRDQARGRTGTTPSAATRPAVGAGTSGSRATAGSPPARAGGASVGQPSTAPSRSPGSAATRPSAPTPASRGSGSSALSGSGNSSFDRSASVRGAQSRGGSAGARGGSRGGGRR